MVETFLFYSGQVEFGLTSHGRFVCAHTTNQPIYEFWQCLSRDPRRLYDIITCPAFSVEDDNMFHVLQDTWPKWQDPYIRSALFYLLNACSDKGMPSTGGLDKEKFHQFSISKLKTYQRPSNFFLQLDNGSAMHETINPAEWCEYVVVPLWDFDHNLFDIGVSLGFEETHINHKKLYEALKELSIKWAVTYNYDHNACELYKDYNITMIDQYGQRTKNATAAQEIVIANF